MTKKYGILERYLASLPASQTNVKLTFDQIERELNVQLPALAKEDGTWWTHPIRDLDIAVKTWIRAGWKVDDVSLKERWVQFARIVDALQENGLPSTLETRQVFRLFRYAVMVAVAVAFLLVTVLYVMLTLRTEALIAALISMTFLLLSVITGPKNVLLNKALAVLGGATPMVMTILAVATGQPLGGLMIIECGLGALGGAGAYSLTNDKWKGFGASIPSELLSKSYRIYVFQHLLENGWKIDKMPDDPAGRDTWITETKIWELAISSDPAPAAKGGTKKRDTGKSAVYSYTLDWKDPPKPRLYLKLKAPPQGRPSLGVGDFQFELYQKQYDLEDKITDIDYRLKDTKTLGTYGLVFSTRWEQAFQIATDFQKHLRNDEELFRTLKDEQYTSEVFLFLERIMPPPLESLSRKRQVERLSTLYDRYNDVLNLLKHRDEGAFSKQWCKNETQKAMASLQTSFTPRASMPEDTANDILSKTADLEQLVENYALFLAKIEREL